MKVYSFLGQLYFLILICITSTTWAFPFEKRSASNLDLKFNRKFSYKDHKKTQASQVVWSQPNQGGDIIHYIVQPQEITTHTYSGNVISKDVSLAEALTQNSEDSTHSSISMVLPIAGTLTVLFSMSILVAIFQCCCRKRQTSSSESEDVKDSSNDRLVETTDSGSSQPKDEGKPDKTQGSENEEKENNAPSIKNRIKAFEGVIPTQPSPGPVRPVKKRPESNAFKALENQGIVYGMGKSPSRLSKTPEDENQNEPAEEPKPENQTKDDDDMGGYKEKENPDVVIADVDENDEFAVIVRDTSVLRSHKRAPPPKNRNRSSAAIRRHRARETTTDLLFNDSGADNSFLMIPDNLSNKSSIHSDISDSREKQGSTESKKDKNKETKTETSSGNTNIDSIPDKGGKKSREVTPKPEGEVTPAIVTTDHSETKIIDLSKQQVPPEVFSGGNIFMHIDPTVKKSSASEERKPATPPTRLRTSQLSVEERKEKAKSTPLLSSHEDLAKALGKLKSPSQENNSGGKNRSSSDLSSQTKM